MAKTQNELKDILEKLKIAYKKELERDIDLQLLISIILEQQANLELRFIKSRIDGLSLIDTKNLYQCLIAEDSKPVVKNEAQQKQELRPGNNGKSKGKGSGSVSALSNS